MMKRIADYYKKGSPVTRVLAYLEEKYGQRDSFSVEELAGIDSFHLMGKAATLSLASLTAFKQGERVLDIGSGPGGTARFLGKNYGVNVTGLDLTFDFCQLSSILSKKTDCSGDNAFLCGDALELPFKSESFDHVLMEHVQMNVKEKRTLFSELFRVLKQNGRLLLFEVFLSGKLQPEYPLPWADKPENSFLVSDEEMKKTARGTGFDIINWNDCHEKVLKWHRKVRIKTDNATPSVINMLMGETPQKKVGNYTQAVLDKRLIVVEGLLKKTY